MIYICIIFVLFSWLDNTHAHILSIYLSILVHDYSYTSITCCIPPRSTKGPPTWKEFFSQNWLSEGLGWGMGLVGLQTFHWRIEISPGLLKRSAGYGLKREVSVPIGTPRCFLLVEESFLFRTSFFLPQKRLGFKTVLRGLTSACPWNLRSVSCKQSLDNGRNLS